MITLSISTITDEIFALTALRRTVTNPLTVPASLTRDNLPAIRVVIHASFARLAAYLAQYISDVETVEAVSSDLDPYNTREPVAMKLDFGLYTQGLTAGSLILLRRYLEHLVALMTLNRIYAGIYTGLNPADPEGTARITATKAYRDISSAACRYATEAEALLESVKEFLSSSDASPLQILPCAY